MMRRVLIMAMLVSMIAFPAVADGVSVEVTPSSVDCKTGDTFTVEILVDPGGYEVYGAQYNLIFDPSALECVSQTAGDFLTQDGASSIEVVNTINNTLGKLEYAETRMGTDSGVTGAGTLARVTFKVRGESGSNLELKDVIVSNPSAQELETSVEDGVCLVNGNTPTPTPTPTPTATATTTDAGEPPTPTITVTETIPETPAMTVRATDAASTPESADTPASTPETAETGTPRSAPGFGIFTICAIILSICIVKRRS